MKYFPLLMVGLLLLVISCEESQDGNQAPNITGIYLSHDSVPANRLCTLFCEASDPEGDYLGYLFSSTAGYVLADSNMGVFFPPSDTGIVGIHCEVGDTEQGRDFDSIYVVVTTRIPDPPEYLLVVDAKSHCFNPFTAFMLQVSLQESTYLIHPDTNTASFMNGMLYDRVLAFTTAETFYTPSLTESSSITRASGGAYFFFTDVGTPEDNLGEARLKLESNTGMSAAEISIDAMAHCIQLTEENSAWIDIPDGNYEIILEGGLPLYDEQAIFKKVYVSNGHNTVRMAGWQNFPTIAAVDSMGLWAFFAEPGSVKHNQGFGVLRFEPVD